jgi:hypothetical protein
VAKRDTDFLSTPPYAYEIGAAAAAVAIWRLLTKGVADERDAQAAQAAQAGKEATPPERLQA